MPSLPLGRREPRELLSGSSWNQSTWEFEFEFEMEIGSLSFGSKVFSSRQKREKARETRLTSSLFYFENRTKHCSLRRFVLGPRSMQWRAWTDGRKGGLSGSSVDVLLGVDGFVFMGNETFEDWVVNRGLTGY